MCVSVWLVVSNITQDVMNGLRLTFMERTGLVRNKLLNFGGHPDRHADSPIRNPAFTQQI